MTKRKSNIQDECLASFSKALKKEIIENLKIHKKINIESAKSRSEAYSNVIFLLKEKAKEFGVSLSDIGLEDYEVPKFEEDFDI
jgi:hypothetical protein